MEFQYISQFRKIDSSVKIPAFCFIFMNEKMLMDINDPIPKIPLVEKLSPTLQNGWIFGRLNNDSCAIFEINSDEAFYSHFPPTQFAFIDLRKIGGLTDKSEWYMCSCAFELIDWQRKTQYCGRCGTLHEFSIVEAAKQCPNANSLNIREFRPP